MTEAVTHSDLDWTIARITNPTDKPAKGTIRAGFLGRDKVGWAISPRRHRHLPDPPTHRRHLPPSPLLLSATDAEAPPKEPTDDHHVR